MKHCFVATATRSFAVACGFWFATPPAAAAGTNDRIEWTVSLGGATNLGTAPVRDRWSVESMETFGFAGVASMSIAASASALYEPTRALGGNGAIQMWLPSGLGAFAELQRQTQDQSSRVAVDASISFRLGPVEDRWTAEGRLDTERFEKADSRLHFGLGYRVKAWRDSYFEFSAGASRISIQQELARELNGDSDCDPRATRCTVQLSIEKRESGKGSTWGLNGGLGFTKFVNKFVGLGAHVRYSCGGELEMAGLDALDADGNEYRTTVKVKTGASAAGAYLRLRF